jgi:ribosomal protein L17
MLLQNTHFKRLSFTTIAFLIGLSFLFTISAQAAPVKKFIGPEGGEMDCHHNSYLIVPAGAIGDESIALEALDNAILLLEDQYVYIDTLSIVENDPSGEWVKSGDKGSTRNKSEDAKDKSKESKQKRLDNRAKDSWDKANDALTKLDELRIHIAKLLADSKMGAVAHDNIQQQSDPIEQELVFAESQLGEELIADSFEIVIALDSEMILADLNNALALLDSQWVYIDGLSIVIDDPSGEWAKDGDRKSTLGKNEDVKDEVIKALDKHNQENDEDALKETRDALAKLDELAEHIDKLVTEGKMGSVARDNIRAYSDDIRIALESVEYLHYETLLFEFGPEGTEFIVPAELVVPWEEILYNDALFWYSADGEVIDLIDLDYIIDEVAETVHFIINHFSYYYYSRR